MRPSKLILIDGDSLAYKAGYCQKAVEMRACVDRTMSNIMADCGSNRYELWLEDWEGKHIFRSDLAVTRPYKGNRTKREKPELLDAARAYLEGTWNARRTKVFESEDVVIRRAYEEGVGSSVVAYIDKDLLQYPLTFYNYHTRSMTILSESEANYNLLLQVITGDSTDNIPGISGIGQKKAAKYLSGIEQPVLLDIAKLYKEKGLSLEYFTEMWNLIRLRDKACTEMWQPVSLKEWNNLPMEEE